MKKFFTFALVAFALTFCACTGDDQSNDNDGSEQLPDDGNNDNDNDDSNNEAGGVFQQFKYIIIDKWEVYQIYVSGHYNSNFGVEYEWRPIYVFNEDGTGFYSTEDLIDGKWVEYADDHKDFTYDIEESEKLLTLTYSDFTETYLIEHLSAELFISQGTTEDEYERICLKRTEL